MYSCKTSNPIIRKFPYPYQGAVSISSDPDCMDFTFFEELMQFMNTSQQTSFGMGLGLEVTAGLFFYSQNPYNFSYYDSDNFSLKSKFSSRVDEYMQSGWIDTNHAYGDFDGVGGFERKHAEVVSNLLEEKSVKMPIFTNHGDASNVQNIGSGFSYHRGDDNTKSEYHVDLLEKMGTEFVWDQTLVDESLSATQDFFSQQPFKKDDGVINSPWGFRRFRGTQYHAPNLSSLSYQLSSIDFKDFYDKKKFVVLYQHLGVFTRYACHCVSATVDLVQKNPHVLSGLYKLHQENKLGKLWVPATARLLSYLKMLKLVKVVENYHNTYVVSTSKKINLDGLTLYVNTSDPVDVLYNDEPLPLRYNGLDETGQYSVTITQGEGLNNIW